MQLLASSGTEGCIENKTFEGLNLIEGKIVSLKKLGSKLILPHIGWNNVKIKKNLILLIIFPIKQTSILFIPMHTVISIKILLLETLNMGLIFLLL